jgi:hypothetical protein
MTARTLAPPRGEPDGRTRRAGARSVLLRSFVADLLALPPQIRRPMLADVPDRDLPALFAAVSDQVGTPYGLWADDPVGFTTDVLGETLWSQQRDILAALITAKEVIVPAGFSVGKTHLAARGVAWMSCCYPVGTALSVTIATRMRQVARQLWPHVRRLHARAGLPGKVDTTQWKMQDGHGVETIVAYGFSPPDTDESAMQGIHVSGRLLLVVDEAGGIAPVIGESTRNLLTGKAVMLAIGNPPTDAEGGWFEKRALAGHDPDRPDIVTLAIGAVDSPAVTGEDLRCQDCPPTVPEHPLADHLVDQRWIDEAIRDFGEDSPYVQAKVYARFPKGAADTIIPLSWLENAAEPIEPDEPTWRRLCDLGLPAERDRWLVEPGAWVRLGVDVAADGGDEMVVARAVGDLFTIEHASSGPGNANAVNVAGKILEQIRRAETLRAALGSEAKVRVKVDSIGVGWGVVSTLTAWGSEGLHDAEIVPVNVAEDTRRIADGSPMVGYRKRDEMWIALRQLVQSPPGGGRPLVRLRVDERTIAQLSGPQYTTTSDGRTKVESKKSLKARGRNSPDRAEAVLLCAYEPKVRRRARLVA